MTGDQMPRAEKKRCGDASVGIPRAAWESMNVVVESLVNIRSTRVTCKVIDIRRFAGYISFYDFFRADGDCHWRAGRIGT